MVVIGDKPHAAWAFRAEIHDGPQGARVEVGTVTHEGRDFAALGSVIDAANGRVTAYVYEPAGGRFVLQTWEGKEIAPLTLTGRWRQGGFGGVKNTIWAWRAIIGGRVYSGRNSGPGMVLHMRTGKDAPAEPRNYDFIFAPEGRCVDTVRATSLGRAERAFFARNPKYKGVRGEIFAIEKSR